MWKWGTPFLALGRDSPWATLPRAQPRHYLSDWHTDWTDGVLSGLPGGISHPFPLCPRSSWSTGPSVEREAPRKGWIKGQEIRFFGFVGVSETDEYEETNVLRISDIRWYYWFGFFKNSSPSLNGTFAFLLLQIPYFSVLSVFLQIDKCDSPGTKASIGRPSYVL